ncbi:hypothetical protein [uncultured Adlercreutzia sp.]|nr:hypothetical protein [uncultured Adlercreutzia sp.]
MPTEIVPLKATKRQEIQNDSDSKGNIGHRVMIRSMPVFSDA